MSGSITIINAHIVTGDGTEFERGTVVVENGIIRSVGEKLSRATTETRDAEGLTLLPGFIDVHIHGGGGADTMDATPDALRTICRTHARYGTTGLLATTMTQSGDAITAALVNARRAFDEGPGFCPDGAQVLGIHLEGPYISPARPGAQPAQFVRDYAPAEFDNWLDITGIALKLITLAPEQPGGMELLAACLANGTVVSLGHTDATTAQAQTAIDAGATHATHLYNAMPPLHHRKPGPIAVFLTDDRAKVEIIADGHHVAPEAIRLALKAKGTNGIILITDAMAGAGSEEGIYDLGGNAVTVRDGKALLPDGTLAGSVLTMSQAAANLKQWANLDWTSITRLTSGNASQQLGLTTCGLIAPSYNADLVLVDDACTVHATIVAGQTVYQR